MEFLTNSFIKLITNPTRRLSMFKTFKLHFIALLLFGSFVSSVFAADNHDQDQHEGDIQPWKIGAEIFLNSHSFESDFSDLPGGNFNTENPGVDVNVSKGSFTSGNWLQFQPVGQLLFWNGSEWVPTVPNGERIELKDALDQIISFRSDGVDNKSAIIGEIDNEGGLHEHLNFSIYNVSNTLNGSVGAYRIQLKLFETKPQSDVSVSIATSPISIIFNRGLEHDQFELAVAAADRFIDHSIFVAETGLLTLQRVKALGSYYQAKLQHIGNNQFQLIEAKEIP